MKTLDELKHTPPSGIEFWFAREIMPNLGYKTWESFQNAINRAKQALTSTGEVERDHFRDITKMVPAGVASVPAADYALTRFACYLIAMNGDPSKPEIAAAQTYFAIQTRRQELTDELSDYEHRKKLRERVTTSVKKLGAAAKDAGVVNYGKFHNAGYDGLYGMTLKQIRALKKLPADEDFLDCLGRAELAANEFKNTQTELRLRDEQIGGEELACETHRHVGQEVRATMKKLGGVYPEELPAEPSLKSLERKSQKPLGS